ncbi:hypothetical protein OROGR_011497 [Orobanche gracilis]
MAGVELVLPFVTRLKLLFYAGLRSVVFRRDGTINRHIYNLFYLRSPCPATKLITPTTLVSTSDISIDPSRNLWFRLFVPTTTANASTQKRLPFILHFHGGGFSAFGPDSVVFDSLCSRLAAEIPSIIASVNYRLAPEHRYPCQYEDAFDSLKFINSQCNTVLPDNTDLGRCFIAGDSAGANIAHHATVRACRNPSEFDKLEIVGLLSVQPFFGGEERTSAPILNLELTDRMWRWFLPEAADRDHHASNVLNSGKLNDVEFPKTLVVVGGYDPLRDWQRRYVEWMEECGTQVELVEYPNAFHSFYSFPEVAEFQMLIDHVREFVQKQQSSRAY